MLLAGLTAVAFLAFASRCDASVYALTDNNSVAFVDPSSQRGMFQWSIEGQNMLQQQWFWYGIGNGAVHSIDTISPPVVVLTSARELTTTYVNPANYSVSVDYLLTGGPVVTGTSGNLVSDIGETIKFVNLSASTLPFHFYQYSYFNLVGDSSDTVQLGRNPRGLYNDALQQSVVAALSETVTTPGANHGEVAPVGMTLAKLNGGGPVTLADVAGPIGPGAVTWALEWDLDIAPGGSVLISKDKYLSLALIPEPSAPALLGVGVLAFALRRRCS